MRKALLAVALFGLALNLAGCGETEQVVVYKQGKYQGKPDTQPWDNEPLGPEFRGSKWNKGDQRGWEEQIKQRQLAQHEHKRIYQ